MEKDDVKKLQKSVDLIAKTTANILQTMATKKEVSEGNLSLQNQINSLSSELKSFKKETRENFEIVNDKLDDITDTNNSYDKRIEKLENKVFA